MKQVTACVAVVLMALAGCAGMSAPSQEAGWTTLLDGPKGFAKDFTTVPFKGSKTFTVALKKGAYKYYCAAHEAEMFGHFTVS